MLSITSSPPFTFVVGPDQKEHTIHSALVARQSAALNALINGRMKESIERRVIWKDVDEEAFIRFSQYVYTGDYDEAKPSKREEERTVSPQVQTSGWAPCLLLSLFWSQWNKDQRVEARHDATVAGFKERLCRKFQALHPLPPPAPVLNLGSPADNDSTDVLLCHAQVYAFADCYGIEHLQLLALHKLRGALASFSLVAERYNAVNQLLRYTFEHTVDNEGQEDRLRSLVCLFVACKVEGLWDNFVIEDVEKMFPDFATEVFRRYY